VKRLPILVMLMLVCFTGSLYAYNAGSTINNVLLAPQLGIEPLVDGVEDAEWTFPEVGMFALIDGNAPDSNGATDISAWFKLGWDVDGIYLFVRVEDDTVAHGANTWTSDCIEIFIDGGNEDAGSLDDNDVQWRWVALEDTMVWCWAGGDNLRPADYELAWAQDANGYTLELAIPAAGLEKSTVPGVQLFTLAQGTEIGFDLQVTDNDSVDSDEGVRWWAAGGSDYSIPANWGTVKLDDANDTLQIPEVEFGAIVDGDLDPEWTDADVPAITMSVIAGGTPNWPDSGKADFSSEFRAAWNSSGFYLFGKVVDDSIAFGTADWNSDCIEIYFDGDNSKAGSYGVDDVQWRWVFGQDSATQGPSALEAEIAWLATADGYNVELAIPATTLADTNIVLSDGDVIGFEVQFADNDGGDREGITKWWSESNDSYLNPSLFGTAVITSSLNEDKVPEEAIAIKLSTPAILTSAAGISYSIPTSSAVKLSLVNLAGQVVEVLVNEAQDAGIYTASVSADLANGVYLCKLDACGETATNKVLLIK
jgi:hypothetical protein